MSKGGGDFDRELLDIIPERFDSEAEPRPARTGHRLRTYLTLGLSVVAVGVIVAVGLHFMRGSQNGGANVPLIRADERPIKVRPDDPGGMQVPNQDKLIYERMEQGEGDSRVERLLPSPEQPQIPAKDVASAQPPRPSPDAEILRPGQPVAPTRPQPVETQQTRPADPPLPKAAAQAPVTRQAMTDAGSSPIPLQPPIAQTQAVAPQAAAPQPVRPSNPPPVQQPQVQRQAPAPVQHQAAVQLKQPPQPAAPAPAPAAASHPKALAGGDWLIQLGALRSAADADREWGRIQRSNVDLLGSLKSDVVRVELGEKGTFWRLRAGPLSEQAARQLCVDLKTRNQGCIIARK